jgi:hypothetical protein
MRAIIETDRKRMVKCAIYDGSGNPIAVDSQIITPPMTEFIFRSGDKTDSVKSVKCWPVD